MVLRNQGLLNLNCNPSGGNLVLWGRRNGPYYWVRSSKFGLKWRSREGEERPIPNTIVDLWAIHESLASMRIWEFTANSVPKCVNKGPIGASCHAKKRFEEPSSITHLVKALNLCCVPKFEKFFPSPGSRKKTHSSETLITYYIFLAPFNP